MRALRAYPLPLQLYFAHWLPCVLSEYHAGRFVFKLMLKCIPCCFSIQKVHARKAVQHLETGWRRNRRKLLAGWVDRTCC